MDIDRLKVELQGATGLISIIRKKHLTDTKQMASSAQIEYESQKNDFSNIDLALEELLKIEYIFFKKRQNLITETFIEYLDVEANPIKYPFTRKIIEEYKEKIQSGISPTTTLNGLVNIIIILADSN